MELGDIVLYQQRRWWVHRRDKMTRTVFLFDQKGERTELADQLDATDPDTVKVLANPGKQWKVLTAPLRANAGPFIRFIVPGLLLRKDHELVPWKDWVPSDPFREGGSVFVRPGVRLLPHTPVLLTYANGTTVRVTVPTSFTTVAKVTRKREREAPKAAEPPAPSRFSMLDDDD